MKTVAASEVDLQGILEEVKTNDMIVITQDGKPVARVLPIYPPLVPMTLDELRKSIHIVGDIMEPDDGSDVEK